MLWHSSHRKVLAFLAILLRGACASNKVEVAVEGHALHRIGEGRMMRTEEKSVREIYNHGTALLETNAVAETQNMQGDPCPFRLSTGSASMQCADGSLCNPHTSSESWNCCAAHGGREQCPVSAPLMCAWKTCHGDSCCDLSCANYGGLKRCEACDEAPRGFNDGAYRGCQQTTRSGSKCQRWDAQAPHTHSHTAGQYPLADLRENFCRNPNGQSAIWCYTMDAMVVWEYCDPMPSSVTAVGAPLCGVSLPLIGSRQHSHVKDAKISVSSYLGYGSDPKAWAAEMWRTRLDNTEATWSAKSVESDNNPWIQWDFGSPTQIEKIQTKGRGDGGQEWVASYKLAFSPYGETWTMLDQLFEGNQNTLAMVENKIDPPVVASMLRLYPTDHYGKITLRAEVLGCSAPDELAVVYHNAECCSGSDCDESTPLENYVSWSQCHDECQNKESCKGFQYGKNDPTPITGLERCTSPGLCACWLITGACSNQVVNQAYDAFMFKAPSIPVRLMTLSGAVATNNGASSYQGRLEIYHNSEWGSVCSSGFTKQSAKVACGMLGLHLGELIDGTDDTLGGMGPIWMDSVNCTGREQFLWQCEFKGWGQTNCDHSSDVVVYCAPHTSPHQSGPQTLPAPAVNATPAVALPGPPGRKGETGPPGPVGENGTSPKGRRGPPGDRLPPFDYDDEYTNLTKFLAACAFSVFVTFLLLMSGHDLSWGKSKSKSRSKESINKEVKQQMQLKADKAADLQRRQQEELAAAKVEEANAAKRKERMAQKQKRNQKMESGM